MPKSLEVYECGTRIKLNLADIEGYIIEVRIQENCKVMYMISYVESGKLECSLLRGYEFTVVKSAGNVKIGFCVE